MDRRLLIAVVVSFLVLSSGCADLFGGSDGQTTPPGAEGQSSGEALYSNSTDTGRLILSLSEVGGDYNLSGESLSSGETAMVQGSSQSKVEVQHSRTFELSDSNQLGEKPLIIISSVVIYESPEAARTSFEATLDDHREGNSTVSQVSVATGINATKVQFQADTGSRNVMLYGRDSNLVYFVLASGQQSYYSDISSQLYIEMYSDVSS